MAASLDPQTNSPPVDKPSDFGTAPEDRVAYWMAQDKIAEKMERKWVRQARKIVKRYRDERPAAISADAHRYNALWSNVQTLEPAIYARPPQVQVSRRYRDQDPVGRLASEILERCISWSLDACDFDTAMKACVKDYLLPGRATMRVLYCPYFGDEVKDSNPDHMAEETEEWGKSSIVASDGDAGRDNPLDQDEAEGAEEEDAEQQPGMALEQESVREVIHEEVKLHYVFWEDYREGPARCWGEVPWVRYRAYMTQDELIDRFGPKGKRVNLDAPISADTPASNASRGSEDRGDLLPTILKEAEVWEIWDKAKRRVIWIAPGTPEVGFLDSVDDPLGLPDFFPSPDPLLATTTNEKRIPVPDYVEYQDQAAELDILTARIDRLVRALKVSGIYAASEKQAIQQLVDEGTENKLIPVENWAMWADKGGLKGVVEWFPIQQVAEVVLQLYNARDRTKQLMYEITGMSDILRGSTSPVETATAQQIKAQFGTLRLNDRQRAVARFARDCIRLVGYVIADQCSPQTISRISGFPKVEPIPPPPPGAAITIDPSSGQLVPTPQMQQYQQMVLPIEQKNQQEIQQFEAACALLREDMPHGFRMDIEADSTILPDEQAEKQARVEFMGAMTPFLTQIVPSTMGNPALTELAKDMTLFLARGFRAGRELESSIEKAFDALAQMPPPQPASAQGDKQGQDQAQGGVDQVKLLESRQKMQTDMADIAAKQQKNQQDFLLGQQKNAIDGTYKSEKIDLERRQQAVDEGELALKMARDAREQAAGLV